MMLAEGLVSSPGDGIPSLFIWTAAVIALGVSVLMYEIAQAVTVAHEGGHALVAALMGGKVHAITLNPVGGGGATVSSGLGWLGQLLVGLAGYLGPSLFGLLGAAMLSSGNSESVLWVSVLLLAIMIFFVGNIRAFTQVVVLGAVIFMVARYASADVQTFTALIWVWWLLIGAVVGALRLGALLITGEARGSDAHGMRRLTWIPATLWVGFFILATVAALIAGTGELTRLSG